MRSLETELDRAEALDVTELADAIETIGFECTRCGACCKGYETADDDREPDSDGDRVPHTDGDREPHTATVFPDEVRTLQEATDYDWRDVARPMPYGLIEGPDGPAGRTFEWALAIDDCGDCRFYREDDDGTGACVVHDDRPLVCRSYPFGLALGGTSQPLGEAVDEEGIVRAHECAGLGRPIDREDAESMAAELKRRAIRELTEAIAVREAYEPIDANGVVVFDSEGAKRPDGRSIDHSESID